MGTSFSFDCTQGKWHVRVLDDPADELVGGECKLTISSIDSHFESLELAAHGNAQAGEIQMLIEEQRGVAVNCQRLIVGDQLTVLDTWGRKISECCLTADHTIWLTTVPPRAQQITAQELIYIRNQFDIHNVDRKRDWSKLRTKMAAHKLWKLNLHGITIQEGVVTELNMGELLNLSKHSDDHKLGKRIRRIFSLMQHPVVGSFSSLKKLNLSDIQLQVYDWMQILPCMTDFKLLTTLDITGNNVFYYGEHMTSGEPPSYRAHDMSGRCVESIRDCLALVKLSWTTYNLDRRYPEHCADITIDTTMTELDLRDKGILPQDAALVGAMVPKCTLLRTIRTGKIHPESFALLSRAVKSVDWPLELAGAEGMAFEFGSI